MQFRFHSTIQAAVLASLIFTPALVVSAQQAPESVDEAAIALIRKHGLDNSQIAGTFHNMTDVYGGRLTGSPELDRATAWAEKTMREMGLVNVKQEAWGPFGRGWSLKSFSMNAHTDVTSFPVYAYPKAWSDGSGGPVSGDVLLLDPSTVEDPALLAAMVKGKVVFVSPPREMEESFEPMATRHDDSALLEMSNWAGAEPRGGRGGFNRSPEAMARMRAQRAAAAAILSTQAAAIVDISRSGDYGTIFVSSASAPVDPNATGFGGGSAYALDAPVSPPQITMAAEHYNRIYRLVSDGHPVRIDLDLEVAFTTDDPMEYNVIGEIKGTDPQLGDELVMLGAHYDGWHAGTGATDNASGSAVMMEAMRILKATYAEMGTAPRRTIRIGLWTGEEQGLNGSRNYVNDHFAASTGRGGPITELKPDHDKFSAYYNYDNGTGKIRGVYLQGNEGVAPIFRAWMKPFHDLGAGTLTLQNTGGTDHLSFDAVGLPGFQFIQEPMAYSTKTHHSNMDVYDHAVIDDLKQSATIVAAFAYHTAQRDQKLPRKEQPEVQAEGTR